MARTEEEIFNEMVAEKQTFADLNSKLTPLYNLAPPTPENPYRNLLDEINSASVVSVWRLLLRIVARAHEIMELMWAETKADMDVIAANSQYGTLPWYAAKIKQWQYGYSLIWNAQEGKAYYADTTSNAAVASRIATRVSAEEVTSANFSGVLIKVAKGEPGNLQPLDDTPGTELESITYYLSRIKPAGVQTSLLSIPPDSIKLNLKRYYDGTLILSEVQDADQQALKQYLANIDFNGVFHINDLIDAFQKLPISKTPTLLVVSCECKADADLAYTTVTETYNPKSGYFTLVPIGSNPATHTVIEYVAL